MNVSATRLIYVNKDGAKVKNEETGDFTNEVPNGIPIEEGDLISIEGIAVESRGVGSSIIEIPTKVKDYPYLTNKMIMKMWYYINHNYNYGCMLPFTDTAVKDSDNGSLGFGYMSDSNISTPRVRLYVPSNPQQNYAYSGKRFYIGSFDENPAKPSIFSNRALAFERNPSTSNFNFLECNREISVDFGYDSPANIGQKITSDLQTGRYAPNTVMFGLPNIAQSSFPNERWVATAIPQNFKENLIEGSVEPSRFSGATGDVNECVATIRAIPFSFNNAVVSQSVFYSIYQGYLGVLNPLYYYYGSRLLNVNNNNKSTDLTADRAGFINGSDILVMNLLTNNGTDSNIQQGELLITNLRWDTTNLLQMRGLIHSQKNYNMGSKSTTAGLRTPQQKVNFYWDIPMGRYLDSTTNAWATSTPLIQPVFQEKTVRPSYLRTRTFYNKEFWETSGYYDKTDPIGYGRKLFPAPDYEVEIDGQMYNERSASQYLDVNLRCLISDGGFSGVPQYYIAIPLIAQTKVDAVYSAYNYCVCDLTMSRKEATAMLIMNPNKIQSAPTPGEPTFENIMKTMSVGCPEMELRFDDQRGRFAFTNMYWSNYIGNTDQAGNPDSSEALNPDADQAILKINANQLKSTRWNDGTYNVFYDAYSQSGLGLVSLAVVDSDGTQYEIDMNNPEDIESKYTNCLFDRLGFNYLGLINNYGRPEVFFQEQFLNTNIKTAYATYFPYPLTNNPEVNTTLNQYISTNLYNAPTFDLDANKNVRNINVSASSSFIYAENLPKKLASPYWIIASDIIDGIKFVKDGQPVNCLAVCNRSYISGDFAFAFATDYKFKADIPFTISSIKTKVLTQDLLPADIDNGTSIIYKIEKQYKSLLEEQQQNTKS